MGLSSKQGSMKGLDNWSGQAVLDQIITKPERYPSPVRQLPQSSPPLECPRCSSSNTKFCYYNNYNRSQPRHFCKSCKRHWTQGGTLRNVPVGGERKNKRLKTTVTTPTTNTNSTSSSSSSSDQSSSYGLKHHDQQPWLRGGFKVLQEACFQPDYEKNIKNLVGSAAPQFLLPFSSGSLLGNNPSLFPLSDSCNYVSTTTNSTITTTTAMDPSTHKLDDSLSYWSWDYFDTLVSTDFKLPWEDFQEQVLEV